MEGHFGHFHGLIGASVYYKHILYTVHGHFCWGEISRKCWQDISRNFHDTPPISFIEAYGFYFRMGVIFTKQTKARKMRKLPLRKNFHVHSILTTFFLRLSYINGMDNPVGQIEVRYEVGYPDKIQPRFKVMRNSGLYRIGKFGWENLI